MTRAHPRFAALWLTLFLCGCNADPPSNLATVQMKLGDKSFTLEVADSTESRSYGLMRRDSMSADHGMLFVFGEEEPRSFWMKNTRIPLDIIFLDHAGKVVSVKQMKPYDVNGTPSDGPATYAIELNKDAATSANVKPGMTIALPQGLKSKD
jgi:uncharacterized membrane protein (UPF0127 family)